MQSGLFLFKGMLFLKYFSLTHLSLACGLNLQGINNIGLS